ncbi:MAG TPA: hypothetical protein P5567_11125 [Kiritimatiellia bacterium]|nr:hypothetical protein [Kiritimatiellia bacterium]HRZ12993.1 hypothetical protein [Kiritimatiellia bacterium]HSA18397.1 hypothetical protein [Kiritimatiellia bacterium]
MDDPRALLQAAEDVVSILQQHRIDAVIIGGVALAAHHYVRQTEDIDLGINADLPALRVVEAALRRAGYAAELREPDAADPLGGVINVTGPFGSLQIISFSGRFPAVIEDALREATVVVEEGSRLKIAPLPHLVAMKLYAGGFKSKADIVELLNRNPDADLKAIRSLCRRYQLTGFDELLPDIRAHP